MKVKLTPELSYIIGLWKEARAPSGIGVEGREELLAAFTEAALKAKVAEPGKVLSGKDSVYFYHTAYRNFFQKIVEEETERFKYKNEYSASFLAGLFDAVGEIGKDGTVCFRRCSKADEMVLYMRKVAEIAEDGSLLSRDSTEMAERLVHVSDKLKLLATTEPPAQSPERA